MYTDKLSQVITTRRTNLSSPSSSKLATLSQRYSLLHNRTFYSIQPQSPTFSPPPHSLEFSVPFIHPR